MSCACSSDSEGVPGQADGSTRAGGALPQAPSSKAAANASMAGLRVTNGIEAKIGMEAINISADSYKYNSKQALGRPAVTSS
jgi:hypothetical protein